MEAVFFIEKEKYSQARDKVSTDDIVSRQSLNFREALSLGLHEAGYYLLVSGTKDGIKKARELLKGLARELKEEEGKGVIEIMKKQEEEAMEGFGGIFG